MNSYAMTRPIELEAWRLKISRFPVACGASDEEKCMETHKVLCGALATRVGKSASVRVFCSTVR